MIYFYKLVMEGFLPYRHKTIVPLRNQGMVRVEGRNLDDSGASSNMAGKSAIMEAIVWCLFGKTLRGLKHDQVVNRKAGKNCYVFLYFKVDSSKAIYCIRRYRKHKRYKNKTIILRDGKPISFRHQADVQKKLEEILGVDFQAFVNSSVFGGFDGSRKQFALLADSDQKRVLDSFLRFERFELAHRRAKILLDKSREEMSANDLSLADQRGKINTLAVRLATLRDSEKVFRKKECDEKRKIKKQLKSIVLPNEKRFDKEIRSTKKLVERLEERLRLETVKKHSVLSAVKKIDKIRASGTRIIGKPCPSCGQVISSLSEKTFLEHLSNDVAHHRRVLEKLLTRVTSTERRVAYGRAYLKRLQKKKNSTTILVNTGLVKRRELMARLAQQRTVVPFSIEIEDTEKEYALALSKLLVLRQKSVELTKKMRALAFWEIGFGNKGVKTIVLRELLPVMNRKLKEYAVKLFRSKVEIEFRPAKTTEKGDERELFHLHYKSGTNSASYSGESSGGRRRIDICVLLVFAWIARSSDLLLCDELLDGLDEAGRESVLGILSEQRGTVLVVTHNRQLKSAIGKVWTVIKKNGVSRLEAPAQ